MRLFRDFNRARRLAFRHLRSAKAREWHRQVDTPESRIERQRVLAGSSGHREPLSRVRRLSWAAAAAVVLATGSAFWILRSRSDSYLVAARVLLAASRGEAFPPQDRAAFERLLPDEAARRAFLRNPQAPETWAPVEARLDPPRTAAGDRPQERLLAPRGRIAETRPVFRFEVPRPAGQEWHYRLTLSVPEKDDRHYAVIQGKGEESPLRFLLPPGDSLQIGLSYTWTVRLDAGRHADLASFYQPEPAMFEVLDPRIAGRIRDLAPTGRESMDRLLRAAAFVAEGLAEEARVELEGFPPDASPEERDLGALLRAEAATLLGDAATVRALKRQVLGS